MQLTLRMVNRRDAGVYECTASNGVGQDAKETIELQVLCKLFKQLLVGLLYSGRSYTR